MEKICASVGLILSIGYIVYLIYDLCVAIRISEERELSERMAREKDIAENGKFHPVDELWLSQNHFLQPKNLQVKSDSL